MLDDVGYLARYFGLDPDEVMDWPSSKRMVWGPVVARLTRMERRIAAVENARANAIAFFEPKDLVKLLKDDEETETSIARSTELTAEEIIAQAEEFRRRPGSGSILDPLRQKKE